MGEFISWLFLPVFMLMILVVMVGGKPETVLKPFFEVIAKVIGAVVTLAIGMIGNLAGIGISKLGGSTHNPTDTKTPPRW